MMLSKPATYLTIILLMLPACHKEAVETIVPEPQEPELSDLDILFRAGVEQEGGVATRGTMMGSLEADLPNDDNEQQPWHIWPWITGDEFTANALYYFDSMTLLGQSFMRDLCVVAKADAIVNDDDNDDDNYDDNYDDSRKTVDWSYAPVKQWPNQGYLDFFAMYPSKEMLSKMRINLAYEAPDLTLPSDMEEDDEEFVETKSSSSRRSRGDAELLPAGISSLRFWHESPLDTVITFRCKMHPAAIEPPISTEEGVMNSEPVIEYNDATLQPDLMFAHHPHMAKPSVSNKVQMSFTHSMMAVRFWLKGADRREGDGSGGSDLRVGSRFRNIGDFTINNVSFGPVYIGGECVAYDNTDWQAYYEHLNEATHYSDEHVKLRYVWKYGEDAPDYIVQTADGSTGVYTMAPPYGGCEYRIPLPYGYICDYHDPIPGNTPLVAPRVIDPAYPLPDEPLTDIFSQRCDFSIKDCSSDTPFSEAESKTPAGWQPSHSTPILPVLDSKRGVGSKYSAFIIPPQMFLRGNPYVKITYTITETTNGGVEPDKMTFTTETVSIPMTTPFINIEDGEILDLYFTFDLDGDDFFKFLIDAQITPWQYGGRQEDEWTNW